MEKDHISFSQLKTFYTCQMQWHYSYREGIKSPPNSAMSVGSSVHAAIEHNFLQKITTRTDLPLEEVIAAAVDDWKKRTREIAWNGREVKAGVDKTCDRLQDLIVGIVTEYQKDLAPRIQPVAVELEIVIPYMYKPTGYYVDIVGRLDVVQEGGVIRDTKVVSQAPSTDNVPGSVCTQMGFYALKYPDSLFYVDYLIKTKKPRIKSLTVLPYVIEEIESQIDHFMECTQVKKNMVPNTYSYMCSPENCHYFKRCRGS